MLQRHGQAVDGVGKAQGNGCRGVGVPDSRLIGHGKGRLDTHLQCQQGLLQALLRAGNDHAHYQPVFEGVLGYQRQAVLCCSMALLRLCLLRGGGRKLTLGNLTGLTTEAVDCLLREALTEGTQLNLQIQIALLISMGALLFGCLEQGPIDGLEKGFEAVVQVAAHQSIGGLDKLTSLLEVECQLGCGAQQTVNGLVLLLLGGLLQQGQIGRVVFGQAQTQTGTGDVGQVDAQGYGLVFQAEVDQRRLVNLEV